MLISLTMILLIFMIVNLLMIISNIISKKTFKDREKNSLLNVDLTLMIQDVYFSPSVFLYFYHIFNFWCSNHSLKGNFILNLVLLNSVSLNFYLNFSKLFSWKGNFILNLVL